MRSTTALTLGLLLATTAARAHDLPLDRAMNGFVKVEPKEAHFVVRVPLDLLGIVQFPLDGPDYDLGPASRPAIDKALQALAHDLALREDGKALIPSSSIGRLTPLADRSFEEYDLAAASVRAPVDTTVLIRHQLGYFDADFTYPIHSPTSTFTLENKVGEDLDGFTRLAIRYEPLNESGRALLLSSGSGAIYLNPPWYQAGRAFVVLGIEHILSGIDHLLFLLCLIIPYRRLKGLVGVITAFTFGHSITLIGSAYSLAPTGSWFSPMVEALIAASIFYMALENIVGAKLDRRWIVAGLFGLVHGFGFSSSIQQQLQFSGSHLVVSLLSFNIGIELGQLGVLCLMVPALHLLFRGRLAGRVGMVLLSAIVAHQAWHWMLERGEVLWQTPRPILTWQGVMELLRWAIMIGLAVLFAQKVPKWIGERLPRFGRLASAARSSPAPVPPAEVPNP